MRVHTGFHFHGSRDWNAGRGDDCQDPSRLLRPRSTYQSDMPRSGVSRKVVRKVIRSEATEFRYEREAQPLPKIGPWSDKLDELLLANEDKASRERLTLIRLFEELRSCGY